MSFGFGDYPIRESFPKLFPGVIGFARCPGILGGAVVPERLSPDLDAIQAWRTDAIICVEDEVAGFPIDAFQFEVRDRGIGLIKMGPSDETPEGLERTWQRARDRLLRALGHGDRLLVVCTERASRGGRLIGWLLIEGGATAEEAIDEINVACPNMLERPGERAAIRDYRPAG